VVELDFGARSLRHVRPHSSGGAGAEETAGWEAADLIAAEHAAFAAAVLDGAPVLVDGAAGRRALEAALRVEQAASS
jgi:predicted dehydrogenase